MTTLNEYQHSVLEAITRTPVHIMVLMPSKQEATDLQTLVDLGLLEKVKIIMPQCFTAVMATNTTAAWVNESSNGSPN